MGTWQSWDTLKGGVKYIGIPVTEEWAEKIWCQMWDVWNWDEGRVGYR